MMNIFMVVRDGDADDDVCFRCAFSINISLLFSDAYQVKHATTPEINRNGG